MVVVQLIGLLGKAYVTVHCTCFLFDCFMSAVCFCVMWMYRVTH